VPLKNVLVIDLAKTETGFLPG